jgi:hypothetical protein
VRRRFWVAKALLVGAALAIPTAAGAQAPTEDSVTGTVIAGTTGRFPMLFEFVFSARSGPSGENPAGQVTVTDRFSGSVTCLTVRGNVTLLKIQVSPPSSFSLVSFRVTDNAGSTTPDLIESTPGTGPASECSSPEASYLRTDPVVSGDVVVVDAPSLPTSKDQCKNGGWRSFPGFRNQGDCTSFVATGGRNPPTGP